MPPRPVALVVGARNVGRAVVADRLAAGWKVLAVARTRSTLTELRRACPGVGTMEADAADPALMAAAIARCRMEMGGLDLVVNAITDPPRDQPFGGGEIAGAPPGRLEEWVRPYLPAAWEVLRQAGGAMKQQGSGTIVQVVGPSGRRPGAGRGPFGVAQMGARALTTVLAQELRPEGVHVALVVADGFIRTDRNPEGDIRPEDVASAIGYLAGQAPSAWTHDLVLTPRAGDWIPTP
ncbi:MAG: SDR family NAD(P)-dependent oxidoreductase [Thermoleophilia bacterium]|jgi:NAD(P)-dependent dehydrogenase (short-subunit alcohol dehydrogenase family)|nr:SDR family NAD(P)-dependent oxidoreductase [Thermoleophilia bacterium]